MNARLLFAEHASLVREIPSDKVGWKARLCRLRYGIDFA